MKGIHKQTKDFFSFVCEEYQTALNLSEAAPYFEDVEQDVFLMENLLIRMDSASIHSLLTKTDVKFLQHICDVHEKQLASGIGRLCHSSAEEDRSAAKSAMAEMQAIMEADQDRWMNYDGYSGSYEVLPRLAMYANNDNLYVGLDCYDPEFGGMDHFTDLTVNLTRLPYLHGAIDTNNNGQQALDFLTRNGFGSVTNLSIPSGFCMFPVFLFKEEKLRKIDPAVFEEYASLHGKDSKPLDTLLADAEQKTQKGAETQRSREVPERE